MELVDAEAARLETRLQQHARSLVNNLISPSQFQDRMLTDLKASHLRMAAFGAGGTKGLTTRHFYQTAKTVKSQSKFLDGFIEAIANNSLSDKQIIARAKLYGISTRTAFFESETITRRSNGAKEAKRQLDSLAQHCADCLRYSTNGRWVLISEIVPPGVNCRCRARCKCRIVYRG